MTGFAIAEYLIVVLEVFLICDVSARGLKAEMVERKRKPDLSVCFGGDECLFQMPG